MSPSARLERLLEGVRRSGATPESLPKIAGPVCIWGAGSLGRRILAELRRQGVETAFFIDNDEMVQGESMDGVEVLPPYLASRRPPLPALVSVAPGFIQAMQLRRMGFEEYYLVGEFTWQPADIREHAESVMRVYDLLADTESRATYAAVLRTWEAGSMRWGRVSAYPQYKHPLVKVAAGDVVINGGGFVGNTACDFARTAGRRCRIFSFEPCAAVFAELSRSIEQRELGGIVEPVNMALWAERTELRFNSPTPLNGNSSVQEFGGELVRATDLDSFVAERGLGRVDLLELDVEGAEPSAIEGAVGVIRRDAPKLMISLYHRPWHLWELPLRIKALVPEYEFYIGHHSHAYGETVLYAVVPERPGATGDGRRTGKAAR